MRITSDTLRAGERYKVLLDGEDVSGICFMADDETGEVGVWLPEKWSGEDDVPEEIRRGKVVIYAMHQSIFPNADLA